MKTREQYLDAVSALRRKANFGALGLILTTGLAILVMQNGRWISLYTGRDIAVVCYYAFQFIVPAVALLLAWKLKSFTKKADLICPACGKPLTGSGRDIKKIVADNKCPLCGHALYAS